MSGERKPPDDKTGPGARNFLSGPKGGLPNNAGLGQTNIPGAQPGGSQPAPAGKERSPLTVANLLKNAPQASPQSVKDPLVGTVLADAYAIIDIIGQGDMATVYRARHLEMDKLVAIKTIRCLDTELMKRFAREVEAHSKLQHPNIVTPIDVLDIPGKQPYFVLEYLEGVSLSEVLICHGKIEREVEIGTILKQVCDALSHAHDARVIHRDLKPGNIVLLEREGNIVAKVVDFGLAKLQDELQLLTRVGQALGSPLYMSPEQCMGLPLSNRSDIYSLGVVAYEMITGSPPFLGETIRDVMGAHCDPHIKPLPIARYNPKLRAVQDLDQTIGKALKTEPELRYATADDFKKAIHAWMFAAGVAESTDPTVPSAEAKRTDSVDLQKRSIYNVVSVKQEEKKKEAEILLRSSRGVTPPPVERSMKQAALMKLILLVVLGSILSLIGAGVIILNLDNLTRTVEGFWQNPAGRSTAEHARTENAETDNTSTGNRTAGSTSLTPRTDIQEGSGQAAETNTVGSAQTKLPVKTSGERRYNDDLDAMNTRRLDKPISH